LPHPMSAAYDEERIQNCFVTVIANKSTAKSMGDLRLNYIKLDFCKIYQTLLSQVKRNLVTQRWGIRYLNVVSNRHFFRKTRH